MFWGLVLEPSKKYTQKVEQSFHISQATLELSSADNEPVQLILQFEGSDFILANLSKKNGLFQVALDLNFQIGDQISFRTIGKGRIHLSGYHVPEDELEGLLNNSNSDESDEETELMDESNVTQPPGKRRKSGGDNQKKKKKAKIENDDEESSDDNDDETFNRSGSDLNISMEEEDEEESDDDLFGEDEADIELSLEEEDDDEGSEEESNVMPQANGESSAKKDKRNKKDLSSPKTPKSPKQEKTPKKEAKINKQESKSPKTPNTGQKKVLEGGVIVEELAGGDGPVAKHGRMVQVYYSGRLKTNNKMFDQCTQGAGFKFRLGKGEVIKGWDIGVNGMKVGSKRRITVPPNLAYGPRGSPPVIPPNSTLVFEVELRGIS